MVSISSDSIRNVVFLSHSSAGKTILSEAAIHLSGAISRLGTIVDGNTVSDHEPEEIKRHSSVQTSIVPCDWRNNKINLIDSSGFPVVDLKVTLYDGSFHPVDSQGICFEIAGEHAFSDCVKQANPVLLEPVMKLAVTVPDSDTGDVISDLNGKRAKILGMEPNGNGTTIINSEAPQAELLRYSMDLRSVTQGRGTFSMEFDHYDDVPAHLFQKLVEQMNENLN